MTKFYVMENGKPVCMQAVKRRGKIYYRRCADTMYNPTDNQLNVRTYLMEASHEAAVKNENREELLNNVKKHFEESYTPVPKPVNPNTELVKSKYPAFVRYIEETENGE